jgi:hypothetical protein
MSPKSSDLKKTKEKLIALKSLLEYRLERTDSALKKARRISRELKNIKSNK